MTIKERAEALRALYAANPELFTEFIQSLADSVGMQGPATQLGSFNCPHCGVQFSVVSTARSSGGTSSRRRSSLKGSVNPLLVRLAKVKGVMVGDIHKQFSKQIGSRAKKMTRDEIRQSKIDWMKSELARLEGGRKTSAM